MAETLANFFMKKLIIPILAISAACGCSESNKENQKTQLNSSIEQSFENYKKGFVEDLWKMYPSWATSQGYHNYDTILTIPDEAYRKKEIAFANANLDSLKKYDPNNLSSNNRTDWYLIENQLKSTIWYGAEFKSYEWDPSAYNPGSTVSEILNNKQASLEDKVRSVHQKLMRLEDYYAAAKNNLKIPTKEHTELAIAQLKGTIGFFETSLKDSINKARLGPNENQQYIADLSQSVASIKGFADHLSILLMDIQKGKIKAKDFRIGKDFYNAKFNFDIQSGLTAAQIYQKALSRKEELHKEMATLSKKLWPKYFGNKQMPANELEIIKSTINELGKTHVKREDFQKEIERHIPILTEFVKKKDLIYLDPSKPLVVRKEPEWMAGVAGASISSPGPYDKNGDTFYNVGSLAAYSPEEAESFLREYNKYILQILNIHEAIPGHYAQLVYSNQSPSIIKSILGNGAMVEGWAVYTERMMMEEGWAKNTEINGRVEEDEMWLMYYKWHLRACCNMILDYSIHTLGMDHDAALKLMTEEAFQEKAEAEGKWRRATLTQVQLSSYFTGYSEIYDLREEVKKKEGAGFNLKKFHEKFLSYGSAPVKYIKEMMLQ